MGLGVDNGKYLVSDGKYIFLPSGTQYSAQYQTVYDSFSSKPSDEIAAYQNAMVTDLVDEGLWTRMDLFYLLANDASDNALINWVNPGTFNCTQDASAVIFDAYEGFTFNGYNYLNTNYSPSEDFSNLTANSATLGVYSRTEFNDAYAAIGIRNSSPLRRTILFPRYSESIYGYINSNTVHITANTTSLGLSIATRTGEAIVENYQNGESFGAGDASVVSSPEGAMFIGAYSYNGSHTSGLQGQLSLAFAMDGISDADASTLNTTIETYMFNIGAGVQYIPEYQAIYDSFSTKPDASIALAQNRLVRTLRDEGLWDRMDLFYVFANDASDNALINWANPGTFDASAILLPTFTAYEGFTGNGASNRINSNYNTTTEATNYLLDNGSWGGYFRTIGESLEVLMGNSANNNLNRFSTVYRLEFDGGTSDTKSLFSAGFLHANRILSTECKLYVDGSTFDIWEDDSNAKTTNDFYFLGDGYSGYSSAQIAIGFAGGGFSDADALILYNSVETYMDAIGKGVQ